MAFLQNFVSHPHIPLKLNCFYTFKLIYFTYFPEFLAKNVMTSPPICQFLGLTCLLSQSSLSFPVLCLHNTRVQVKQKSLKNTKFSILLIKTVLGLYQIHIIICDLDFSSILPKLYLESNLFKLFKQSDMKEACFCLDIS